MSSFYSPKKAEDHCSMNISMGPLGVTTRFSSSLSRGGTWLFRSCWTFRFPSRCVTCNIFFRFSLKIQGMESFRTRTLSSGEDVSEIISRTPEHTNHNSHSNHKGINNISSLWSGFTVHTKADDSDEHSVKKKTLRDHSYIYTFLSTVLFTVALIVEKIFHFKLFESSHASIFFFWFESCAIALFFRFWGRKRIRR